MEGKYRRMHPIIVCLVVCILCMTPCCSQLESYRKPDKNTADCVIDITDMLDYDPVTKTSARCERMRRERERAALKCDGDLEARLQETKKLLDECTRRLEGGGIDINSKPPPVPDPSSEVTSCHEPCSAEDMFFRRLTRHLVNVLQVEAPDEGPVEAEMQVRLTRHDWQKLQKFVKGKDYRKADIHDVLVGMTISAFHTNQTGVIEWISEQVNLKSPGVILFIISFLVLVMVFGVGMYSDLLWNGRFLTCVMIAIFLISYLWNWIYLYQEETIKRYRNAQKFPNIPASCMPDQMSWFQTLREWYRTTVSVQTDPCLEYHRLYLVDPLFDIPPTRALTFTLSAMFVDPMKYMGRAVSEFHAEIFRDLPLWGALPALLTCYVFMFFAMYAYIAAPRRVRREAPYDNRPRRIRGREGQIDYNEMGRRQPIEGHQHQQIEDNYNEGIRRGAAEPHEEGRVENIKPPILPAKEADDHRAEAKQVRDEEQYGPKRHVQQGLAGEVLTRRNVRPHGDGKETQIRPTSLAAGASRPQRPTHLKKLDMAAAEASGTSQTATQRPRQVGDSPTGASIHHPESEYSSLSGSTRTVDSTPDEVEPEASLSPTCTSPTVLTPVTSESPSDVSVISTKGACSPPRASPEDVETSASYSFISDSTVGLGGNQVTQFSDDHNGGDEGDDDDDDFEILSKSSMQV